MGSRPAHGLRLRCVSLGTEGFPRTEPAIRVGSAARRADADTPGRAAFRRREHQRSARERDPPTPGPMAFPVAGVFPPTGPPTCRPERRGKSSLGGNRLSDSPLRFGCRRMPRPWIRRLSANGEPGGRTTVGGLPADLLISARDGRPPAWGLRERRPRREPRSPRFGDDGPPLASAASTVVAGRDTVGHASSAAPVGGCDRVPAAESVSPSGTRVHRRTRDASSGAEPRGPRRVRTRRRG